MNGFIWILIGAIAAVIAKRQIRNSRWFGIMLTAIIGAFIGGSIYGLLVRGSLIHGSGMLPIGSVFTAVLGSVVSIWGYGNGRK